MSKNLDYSSTVNLPKTNFSMKANLIQKEPNLIKFWEEKDVYKKLLEKNKKNKVFILHDGPPYANGNIHIGHALNKILKDVVVKYKSLCGYYSPYIPGWDCHGLPIEYQLLKELKITKEQISQLEFRKKAKDYANKYVRIQKEEFIQLGILGDWEQPYLTMNFGYEKNIVNTLKKLTKNGYIIKRKKPVYWCIHCETSLAEAEVEYENKISDSIYVKFPVYRFSEGFNFNKLPVSIVIWTTTPWTLPANLALAIKPNEKYVVVKYKDEYLIVMLCRVGSLKEFLLEDLEVIKEFYGEEIAKDDLGKTTICKHPFIERFSYCIPYENVSVEDGTGIIHIAPGHGEEDYALGLRFGLDIYSPVNNKGRFEDEKLDIGELKLNAQQVFKANETIIEYLKNKNLLVYNTKITHSYPHCWRCKKPVIFRATEQWFLQIEHHDLRKKLVDNIKSVKWVPAYGENRITSMVESRPDWCLSRQRYWGVPIPALYCKNCNEVYLDEKVLDKVEEIFEKEGSDSWFSRDIKDFLPQDYKCEKCENTEFRKETDILDVWFDSSVSYRILEDLNLPKEKEVMYLEGSDQHRGWFQVSLITSTATEEKAPFSIVLTHGFVVDGEGKKMSKSLGNVIAPQDVTKHHGSEILRLWSASSDYSLDVRISKEILDRLIETYRKIRNTLRYILGNLYDFTPEEKEDLNFDDLDKYILSELSYVVEDIMDAYEDFKFYKVISTINNFFIKQLSNFYFDVLKDKLYTYRKKSKERRASQFVLYEILLTTLPLISPILSFTAEEAWQEAKANHLVTEESVFLVDISDIKNKLLKYRNKFLREEFNKILELRETVNLKLEELRKNDIIGSSLEAEIKLEINPNEDKKLLILLQKYNVLLPSIFIVSSVEIILNKDLDTSLEIKVNKFNGVKCPRCWVYFKSLSDKGVCEKCKSALEEINYEN
ncbi:MAG: isoleucine--tRNA ligase [Endomicrobia bacterium]|nr:isoleucine--tRNA ligase [Endomicrobiia bacterium]